MRNTMKTLAALAGAGLLVGAAVGLGPSMEREGSAEHREALRAIESKPLDASLLSGLDSWTHGEPIDLASLENKVGLIAVIAVNDPQSMLICSTLARYQRQHGDDGLVALVVHPEQGWEGLSEKVAAGRIKVQAARDVGGAFAKGVHADNYPDLFLIDRAGQLRYADIANGSLKSGVAQLLRETPEEAIANAELEAQGLEIAAAEEEQAEPETREIPPALYARADWPETNQRDLNARDYQGKQLPVALGGEEWITEERDLSGQVVVLDFWATWCPPCRKASPMLEKLQVEHQDRLEVLAIGGQREDEGTVRKYAIQKKHAYSHLFDAKQSIYRELGVTAIPHTVIMSTDGVIRWQGNPLDPAFKAALEQVLAVDPMFRQDG